MYTHQKRSGFVGILCLILALIAIISIIAGSAPRVKENSAWKHNTAMVVVNKTPIQHRGSFYSSNIGSLRFGETFRLTGRYTQVASCTWVEMTIPGLGSHGWVKLSALNIPG